MLIFSLLPLSLVFVRSPSIVEIVPIRIDYYESISNPVICMEVSHFNPTGPRYLYGEFIYIRHSNLPYNDKQRKHANYSFKKLDRKCKNSLIFTTLGDNFKKLVVKISLYLYKWDHFITQYEYTFYEGFAPGVYQLLDIEGNFIIHANIINETKNYLGISESLDDETVSYLKSIKIQTDHLCVITDNNPAVVLQINNVSDFSMGLVTGLQIMIFQDGLYFGERIYSAYECHKDITYPDKPSIFITNGKGFSINFIVIYVQYFADSPGFTLKNIELSNPIFGDVHRIKTIPIKYNKIFAMRPNFTLKGCGDTPAVWVYLSEDKTKYYADLSQRIKISSHIASKRTFVRSPEDPCKE